MNTRDLFEQLVADEPPLTISPSAASARGRHARTRRTAVMSAAAAAVVVLVTVGVVALTQLPHADNEPGKPKPTPVSTGAPGSTIPFSSTTQVKASAAAALAVIRAAGAARGAIVEAKPAVLSTGVTGAQGALVETVVQYAVGKNSGLLDLLAAAPSEYSSRYAPSVTSSIGPCAPRGGLQLVHCVRTALAKGAVLWTYDEQATRSELYQGAAAAKNGAAPVTFARYAILVEGDRSVLTLNYSLQLGQRAGGSEEYTSLDTPAALTTAQLAQLAEAAATAWQGSAPDAAIATGVQVNPSSAPQAPLGPPMASEFAANRVGYPRELPLARSRPAGATWSPHPSV